MLRAKRSENANNHRKIRIVTFWGHVFSEQLEKYGKACSPLGEGILDALERGSPETSRVDSTVEGRFEEPCSLNRCPVPQHNHVHCGELRFRAENHTQRGAPRAIFAERTRRPCERSSSRATGTSRGMRRNASTHVLPREPLRAHCCAETTPNDCRVATSAGAAVQRTPPRHAEPLPPPRWSVGDGKMDEKVVGYMIGRLLELPPARVGGWKGRFWFCLHLSTPFVRRTWGVASRSGF